MSATLRPLHVPGSLVASQIRGWRGTLAFRPARQPEQLLELYEFEACPFCRLVREALTELDLDARIFPCPRGGARFRPRAEALAGKMQFPLLVDPNAGGRAIHESAAIIAYLLETYGGRLRARAPLRPVEVGTSALASATRGRRGGVARPSRAPERPLELFSFESSPYSRPVRERLSELELPYVLRNTGKALWKDMGPPSLRRTFFPDAPVVGRNRTALLARAGRVQVPYLIDPNTGVEMFESADICAYLERTYAA